MLTVTQDLRTERDIDMPITERDMEHPKFWILQREASKAVIGEVGTQFAETVNDSEARAIGRAIDELTKVKLIAVKRAQVERDQAA